MSEGLECKINVCDETPKVLEPQGRPSARICGLLRDMTTGFVNSRWRILAESWNIGVQEPKKLVHCLKVGLALSLVSVFYYMRPLYEAVGGNAIWALMTVVIIFEYTVGATLCKGINRAIATVFAGSLGIGVHWVAGHCGKQYEPIVIGISIFTMASAATFSRFIPSVKARFDYGAVVFILTFTFVSVSGYRVDKLVTLAEGRVSTIAIGTSLCILVNMLFWPAWAGDQLHHHTVTNLEKLAFSLEGCVFEYFSKSETSNVPDKDSSKQLQGYKCLLDSQAMEESMANFARWEPAHGRYHSGHPWNQYVKIGAAARRCAYCIDNLNSCTISEIQAPEFLKTHIKEKCITLSIYSSEVLKELAAMIKTRIKSPDFHVAVEEMKFGAEDLQNSLLSISLISCQNVLALLPIDTVQIDGDKDEKPQKASILELLPLGCMVTLVIESVTRIDEIVQAVDKLATLAEFKSIKSEERKSRVKVAE